VNRWGIGIAASLVAISTLFAGTATASSPPAGQDTTAHCARWHLQTVKSGLGILESILPDGHGGMLLSSTTGNAIERLSRSGVVTKVASASSPGQLVKVGHRVLFPTGDDAASGTLNRDDGTLKVLNPKTGKVTAYAKGLTMPNGLALDPRGNAYVTRDVGSGTGITRIAAGAPHHVMTKWSTLTDTNGIAISANRRMMYVDRTFTKKAPIVEIPLNHPGRSKRIGELSGLGSGVPKGLDDLIMGPHGVLYLPANLGGEVFSFNTHTHHACLIASGLQDPSAIAIGTGHGWRKGSLFVCGFDGTVRELDPPTSSST
jgi:hypothetical protein